MSTAIITGASKGIGREVSMHLAKSGYNVVLISRTSSLLESLEKEITQSYSTGVDICPIDVFSETEVNKAINNAYQKYGSIDLLFNNAGFVKRGTSNLSSGSLQEMINTNLIGAINMIRAVTPYMVKNAHGCIINVSSRNAKIPRPFLGGYAASKAALLAFNESLYKELTSSGIKVTALCPGFVNTEMTSDVQEDRNHLIQPCDICTTIDYLLSLPQAVAIKEICFESMVQAGKYC